MPSSRPPPPLTPLADNDASQYAAYGQDPTALTTQQLLRENFWLREFLEARIKSTEDRIDQGDKAVQLLQAFADRTPTTMDVKNDVTALREVVFEKFSGIKTQLEERDAATEKASKDVKSAVDAAFAAAKEAVGEQNKSNALSIAKSEAGFTKQIDGIAELIKSTAKTNDDKISDIKDRLTIIESRAGTVTEIHKDSRDNMGLIVAVAAVVIAVGALFIKH